MTLPAKYRDVVPRREALLYEDHSWHEFTSPLETTVRPIDRRSRRHECIARIELCMRLAMDFAARTSPFRSVV